MFPDGGGPSENMFAIDRRPRAAAGWTRRHGDLAGKKCVRDTRRAGPCPPRAPNAGTTNYRPSEIEPHPDAIHAAEDVVQIWIRALPRAGLRRGLGSLVEEV